MSLASLKLRFELLNFLDRARPEVEMEQLNDLIHLLQAEVFVNFGVVTIDLSEHHPFVFAGVKLWLEWRRGGAHQSGATLLGLPV